MERAKAWKALGSACVIILRQGVIHQIFFEYLQCAGPSHGFGEAGKRSKDYCAHAQEAYTLQDAYMRGYPKSKHIHKK